MNILLAVDGSEASLRATQHAIALARGDDGQAVHHIFLINVQESVTAPEIRGHMPAREIEAMQQSRGGDALESARALLAEAGLATHAAVLVGEVADTLATHAQNSGCALIIMGRHDHDSLRGMIAGSVATALLGRTALPVTLVK